MENLEISSNTRPGIYLQSADVRADLFATYAMMREKHPVCQVEPEGMWAISRFDDVRYVLENPEIFSASAADALYDFDASADKSKVPRLIMSQDPPEHGKYQRLVNKAFLDKATKPLIPMMRDTAQSLLTNFSGSVPVDFVENFTYPYIGTIIRRIVGLDDKQSLAELREWVELEESVALTPPDDAFVKAYKAAVSRQNGYFTEIMNERRSNPRDDLVTHLVNAKVDGHPLSDEEICALLCLLVSAGFITTIHTLNDAVILLAQKPDVLAELRESPQLLPAFIEELFRFSPSVLVTVRTATQAVTIADVEIPAGETVMTLLASANRDPSAFPNPDVFDLSRPRVGRHLAFGHGVHTCLGAALARLELKIALETLLAKVSQIACPADEDLVRNDTLFTRGVSALPVRFH